MEFFFQRAINESDPLSSISYAAEPQRDQSFSGTSDGTQKDNLKNPIPEKVGWPSIGDFQQG